MDDIDQKIAELQELKIQRQKNNSEYFKFLSDNPLLTTKELYYYVDDVNIFKELCRDKPFKYDAELLMDKAIRNCNIKMVTELVLQGFDLYFVERQFFQFNVKDYYKNIVDIFMKQKDIKYLKFLHEHIVFTVLKSQNIIISDQEKDVYLESRHFIDQNLVMEVKLYKPVNSFSHPYISADNFKKNILTYLFNLYMDKIIDFKGDIFDWVFINFRNYCQTGNFYSHNHLLQKNLTDYVIEKIKQGNLIDLKTLSNIFDFKQLGQFIKDRDNLHLLSTGFGLEFYSWFAETFGFWWQSEIFINNANNIDFEVVKYIYKKLPWGQYKNDSNMKQKVCELIYKTKQKNNRQLLSFLLNFDYPIT